MPALPSWRRGLDERPAARAWCDALSLFGGERVCGEEDRVRSHAISWPYPGERGLLEVAPARRHNSEWRRSGTSPGRSPARRGRLCRRRTAAWSGKHRASRAFSPASLPVGGNIVAVAAARRTAPTAVVRFG